jgi:hypothetical protein
VISISGKFTTRKKIQRINHVDKTVEPALTNEWKLRMQQENENIKTGTEMFAL